LANTAGSVKRSIYWSTHPQASTPKLSGLTTCDAARVAEAYVQLRAQPPRWWLSRLLSTSLHCLHLGSAPDAACLLYAGRDEASGSPSRNPPIRP
jgi:hypothetical protein